jgi:hypothetical protein
LLETRKGEVPARGVLDGGCLDNGGKRTGSTLREVKHSKKCPMLELIHAGFL